MKDINTLNNKVKFVAFGETRKTNVQKKSAKKAGCRECRGMGGEPGGLAGGAVTAQGMAGQQNSGMDDEEISAQGMDKQQRECTSCSSKDLKLQEILQTQSKRLEDEINEIKTTGVGRMARVKTKDSWQ